MGTIINYLIMLVLAFAIPFSLVFLIFYLIKSSGYKGSAYYSVTHKSFWSVLTDKGAYGEYLVNKYLQGLNPQGNFLFNVYIPKDNGETIEIDVLLIHQSGIYVFESKNYSGWIFGKETQRQWTQTLPSKGRSQKNHFLNPIMQNELHIKWLKSLLSEYLRVPFYSYILFSDRCVLKNVQLTSDKAQVMNRYDVFQSVNKKASETGIILNQNEINKIYQFLYPYSQTSEELKQKHVADIKSNHPTKPFQSEIQVVSSNTESNFEQKLNCMTEVPPETKPVEQEKTCPKCGKPMILRTSKKGENAGNQFWGCSGFPHCRYVEKFEDASKLPTFE